MHDNIVWIKDAQQNNLVVGSQARILYADSEGRINIARAINKAINSVKKGKASSHEKVMAKMRKKYPDLIK